MSGSDLLLGSTLALLFGTILDRLIGDPRRMPHLVRGLGWLIAAFEKLLRGGTPASPATDLRRGRLLVVIVLVSAAVPTLVVLVIGYRVNLWLGVGVEALICFQCLAARSLRNESDLVRQQLLAEDLPAARTTVSMIVGRDTADLDAVGITRAAVETIAENTSDGVVAPTLAIGLLGGFGGVLYKAVNTMDSMVGYRDERYQWFGRPAARLDDAVNWIPARCAALLMITATWLQDSFGGTNDTQTNPCRSAFRIWRRDHANHASPNSAHTEAVCAGALGVQLGGPSHYRGVRQDKPTIGEPTRALEPADIARANQLMSLTGWLATGLVVGLRLAVWTVTRHV
jgi:adenosylcobinamide-phosphate synthase